MRLTPRNALAVVLVALVLSGAVLAAGREAAPAAPTPGAPSTGGAGAAEASTHLVRVYYFRTTARCVSCKKIEAYTDEAVRSAFARELGDGRMVFKVVNVEESGNGHFIRDYKLATKSVVVVDLVNGGQVRWKNLPRIWELLGDQAAFARYVQDEVRQYLEGRS